MFKIFNLFGTSLDGDATNCIGFTKDMVDYAKNLSTPNVNSN